MAVYLKYNEQGGGNLISEETENGFGVRLTKDTKGNWQIEEGYSLADMQANIENLQDGQYLYYKSSSPFGEDGKTTVVDATYFNNSGTLTFYGKTISHNSFSYGFGSNNSTKGNYSFSLDAELGGDPTDGAGISYSYNNHYARIKLYTGTDNKPYIAFQDETINNGNEVKLSEFALKSDIPSGVDLTNYKGDWSLSTVDKTYYSRPCTYSFSIKNIPSGEGDDLTEPIMVLDSTYTITDIGSVSTGLVLYGGYNQLYRISGLTLEQYIGGASPSTDHVIMATVPGAVLSSGRESGNVYLNRLTCSATNVEIYSSTNDTKASVRACSNGSSTGIIFQDTTIQSAEFSLKSLVDRIAALESKVTELETALANKANTASPTFTGKVSISNQ